MENNPRLRACKNLSVFPPLPTVPTAPAATDIQKIKKTRSGRPSAGVTDKRSRPGLRLSLSQGLQQGFAGLGSQLTVRMPGESERPEEVTDLDGLIAVTIRTARRHGYSLKQLHDRVGECLIHQSPDHILVTSSDSGLRLLIQEELREHLDCEMEVCSNENLLAEPDLAIGALVVGAPGTISEVARALPENHPAVAVIFSSAREFIEMIRLLSEPSLIALVSVSEVFLQTARGVLARIMQEIRIRVDWGSEKMP